MRILPILLAALLTSTLPLAAQDLPPGTMILTEDVLPEYESTIDHAKLIDPKKLRDSIKQGEKVYHQVCFNCHGDRTIPGSLPNSLRFAEGKFQHGKDPYTMYQTLTRGWRLMPPQVQLTPREKYAVIHYIREEIVGKYNEDEYFEVSDDYLDKLPKGDQIGPEPVRRREWIMDPFSSAALKSQTKRNASIPGLKAKKAITSHLMQTSPIKLSRYDWTAAWAASQKAKHGSRLNTIPCASPEPGPVKDLSTGTLSISTEDT